MLTTEKEILLPLLPGLEPESFRSRVRRSTTELSQLPPFCPFLPPHVVSSCSLPFCHSFPPSLSVSVCLSVCLSVSLDLSSLPHMSLSPSPASLYYPRLSLRHFFSPSLSLPQSYLFLSLSLPFLTLFPPLCFSLALSSLPLPQSLSLCLSVCLSHPISVRCIYADCGAIGRMMSDTYPARRLLGKELSHQRGKEFNKWMKIWRIIMDVEGQHRRPNSDQNSP